jgi:hypothetical protein
MYNFYSKNKKNINNAFLIITLFISGFLVYFAPTIFKESNVYFYTSSTIVQGFIALVALLGTVVVFKIQLEDQAMQKISDGAEELVVYYLGAEARLYTPTQMYNACEKILGNNEYFGNKNLIQKVFDKMKETLASRGEIRSKMVDFAVISFVNVSIALISLVFTPIFAKYWYVGGILLTLNVYFSIFILGEALQLVRKIMGYDFKI